jgi:predicted N-acetyltransferase YhbS
MTENRTFIRDFQPADAQRVNEISVAAFALLSHRYSDWSAMRDRIATTSRLAAEMPMYVVLYNGTVVGSVALTPPGGPRPDFFDSDCAVIRMLVVDPVFHGKRKGIGSALLDYCIETARRQNYGRIHLHTSTAMEVALPLYAGALRICERLHR